MAHPCFWPNRTITILIITKTAIIIYWYSLININEFSIWEYVNGGTTRDKRLIHMFLKKFPLSKPFNYLLLITSTLTLLINPRDEYNIKVLFLVKTHFSLHFMLCIWKEINYFNDQRMDFPEYRLIYFSTFWASTVKYLC